MAVSPFAAFLAGVGTVTAAVGIGFGGGLLITSMPGANDAPSPKLAYERKISEQPAVVAPADAGTTGSTPIAAQSVQTAPATPQAVSTVAPSVTPAAAKDTLSGKDTASSKDTTSGEKAAPALAASSPPLPPPEPPRKVSTTTDAATPDSRAGTASSERSVETADKDVTAKDGTAKEVTAKTKSSPADASATAATSQDASPPKVEKTERRKPHPRVVEKRSRHKGSVAVGDYVAGNLDDLPPADFTPGRRRAVVLGDD